VTEPVSTPFSSEANTSHGMEMLPGLKPMTDDFRCFEKISFGLVKSQMKLWVHNV
jgi:hypothetical protein